MACQDSLERREKPLSSSFGLGKSNQRNRVSRKNYKAEVLVLSFFFFVLGMCAIVTYLFLAQ
jgi:hypothetical protein